MSVCAYQGRRRAAIHKTKGTRSRINRVPNVYDEKRLLVAASNLKEEPSMSATPTKPNYSKMSKALIRNKKLSDRAFRFYAELRLYAWESTGSDCTAEQAKLCADLGWSPEKVLKAGRELEEIGLVKIKRTGRANRYTLTGQTAVSDADAIPADSGSRSRETAVSDTAEQRDRYVEANEGTNELSSSTATTAAAQTSTDNTSYDRAVELAAFVKAKTNIEPKVGPGDAARLEALFSEHGEDTYWQAATFAANDTKRWGERITDKLSRYTGGFEFVLRDMAKKSASVNVTGEDEFKERRFDFESDTDEEPATAEDIAALVRKHRPDRLAVAA